MESVATVIETSGSGLTIIVIESVNPMQPVKLAAAAWITSVLASPVATNTSLGLD